jgi:hypothetical protein
MRAVCASTMKCGRKATAATSARFQAGARKRRPMKYVRTTSSTPQSADGRRIAHSVSPNTDTDAAMR